ncbi:MAG: hypothetical protein AAGD06_00875 [Acidobacteriota bacterium]
MSADALVRDAMKDVPKTVAAGVVDMASGMMLSVATVESHPQDVLDILAPATKEMFEGELVLHIESLFKKARGVNSDERYFQEIMISSRHLWHYFGRLKSNPSSVLTVVARGDVNMGLFLVKARALKDSGVL